MALRRRNALISQRRGGDAHDERPPHRLAALLRATATGVAGAAVVTAAAAVSVSHAQAHVALTAAETPTASTVVPGADPTVVPAPTEKHRQSRASHHRHHRHHHHHARAKRVPTAPATAPVPTAAASTVPSPTGSASVSSSPLPTGTTPTPQSVGSAGTGVPIGDVPGWHQVFKDDFTTDAPLGSFPGQAYGKRWTGYDGFKDSSGAGLYSTSRVLSVHDGVLDMHLRTEGGQALAAAPVPLVDGSWGGQHYGKFSVRFRADPVPGYGMAWLLWPDSNTWSEGEVDFPEGDLDKTLWAYDHCVGDPARNCLAQDTGKRFDAWQTASVEWTPAGVRYLLDGRTVAESTTSPSTALHWVLQTGTSGGRPPASASGHVLVDWVAIYTRA